MKTKNFLIIFITIILIIPNMVLAVWWNPFTWFKRSIQYTSPSTQPTIEELSKEIDVLQKQINERNSVQSQKTESTVIQKTQKISPVSIPFKSDSVLKVAKCKGLYDVKIGKIENEVNTKLVNLIKEIGDEMGINLFTLPDEIKRLQARQKQIQTQMLTAPASDYSNVDPQSIIRASNARGQEYAPALESVVQEISRKTSLAYVANKALEEAKKTIHDHIQQQYNEEYLTCLNQ